MKQRSRIAQPVIEPGGAGRRHLPGKVDVRSVGEHEGWTRIIGAAEPAHLYDAADWRCMLKHLDTPEAHMVGPAIGAVDHRIGFARQLVMQPLSTRRPMIGDDAVSVS